MAIPTTYFPRTPIDHEVQPGRISREPSAAVFPQYPSTAYTSNQQMARTCHEDPRPQDHAGIPSSVIHHPIQARPGSGRGLVKHLTWCLWALLISFVLSVFATGAALGVVVDQGSRRTVSLGSLIWLIISAVVAHLVLFAIVFVAKKRGSLRNELQGGPNEDAEETSVDLPYTGPSHLARYEGNEVSSPVPFANAYNLEEMSDPRVQQTNQDGERQRPLSTGGESEATPVRSLLEPPLNQYASERRLRGYMCRSDSQQWRDMAAVAAYVASGKPLPPSPALSHQPSFEDRCTNPESPIPMPPMPEGSPRVVTLDKNGNQRISTGIGRSVETLDTGRPVNDLELQTPLDPPRIDSQFWLGLEKISLKNTPPATPSKANLEDNDRDLDGSLAGPSAAPTRSATQSPIMKDSNESEDCESPQSGLPKLAIQMETPSTSPGDEKLETLSRPGTPTPESSTSSINTMRPPEPPRLSTISEKSYSSANKTVTGVEEATLPPSAHTVAEAYAQFDDDGGVRTPTSEKRKGIFFSPSPHSPGGGSRNLLLANKTNRPPLMGLKLQRQRKHRLPEAQPAGLAVREAIRPGSSSREVSPIPASPCPLADDRPHNQRGTSTPLPGEHSKGEGTTKRRASMPRSLIAGSIAYWKERRGEREEEKRREKERVEAWGDGRASSVGVYEGT